MKTLYRTTLGDLISLVYDTYLTQYGDAELASLATAVTINGILVAEEVTAVTNRGHPEPGLEAYAA